MRVVFVYSGNVRNNIVDINETSGDIMSKVQAMAPGKLYVAGEYAVVDLSLIHI